MSKAIAPLPLIPVECGGEPEAIRWDSAIDSYREMLNDVLVHIQFYKRMGWQLDRWVRLAEYLKHRCLREYGVVIC